MNYKISKPVFYILSWTWGLPMTLIGAIISLILIIGGQKPKKWNYCYYFEVGNNWGGCELGMFFLKDKTFSIHTMNHETGHSIQNCYLGFFMPFIVCIPSAVRYWYRKYLTKIKKVPYYTLPDYDAIWFEGSATKLGTDLNGWLKGKSEESK